MQTILITGATDGIGLALARIYMGEGVRLVLIGRKSLNDLADPVFSEDNYCQADLSQPDCAERVMAFLQQRMVSKIDLVIQNAGVGYVGEIGAQSADSIQNLIHVNLAAPIRLTHALFPLLHGGKLVFISSIASALPAAEYATYTASKAALDGFARSLRVELAGKVDVQIVHPGATKTGMHAKVGMSEKQYRRFPAAEKVVERIVKSIETNRRTITIGTSNAMIRNVAKRSPRLIEWAMRRKKRRLMSRSSHTPLHVVITGAADGIGRSLAFRYAKAGYHVTGVDVDAERAAATEQEIRSLGAEVRFIVADLTHDLSWITKLPSIDVLIHNAGISQTGHFIHSDVEKQMAVLGVNLTAPLRISADLLQANKLNTGASLVFISSLSKFVSYPSASVYAASKDGLAHYARCLRVALWPQQHVLTVYPGPIRTAHARRYSPDNSRESSRMSPDLLADKIFEAQQAHKRELMPGAAAQGFAIFGRVAPRLAEKAMKRALLDKFPLPNEQ